MPSPAGVSSVMGTSAAPYTYTEEGREGRKGGRGREKGEGERR
jgi:hypothetical protein